MQAPPPLMVMDPPFSAAILLNHPDSVDSSSSSPRWPPHHEAAEVPGAKLRLMCSYGGHIMPRPHDKSLTYMGGDTRMVAVERHTSLKELCSRLSRTLVHGRAFSLKYQLPNEDLDSLISVSTDDDLENMIHEHDRLASSKPLSRLGVFLFLAAPESAVSMGCLLEDAKSETWFVDALNNSGILDRVVSDSAAVESLVISLDAASASGGSSMNDQPPNAAAALVGGTGNNYKKEDEDDGSSRRVQVVMDEQFAQLTFGIGTTPPPSIPISDEDALSDHVPPPAAAAAAGYCRKPPLPLQIVPPPARTAAFALTTSPDSVASDSSIASANSMSKGVYYHHQEEQQPPPPPPAFSNASTGTQVPLSSSYYPVYVPHQQQQQYQYPPVYVMPVGPPPTQPYTNSSNTIIPDPNMAPAYKDTTPAFLQIPSNQFQHQQYVLGLPHHHPTHPPTTNYAAAAGPISQQVYYTTQHHQSTAPPDHYHQSMTPAAAALSDVSNQFPVTDNNIQQQHHPTRTTHPV